MAYKTNNFDLDAQPIAGRRRWLYSDTGDTPATVVASGFFADAGKKGVKVGDPLKWCQINGASSAIYDMVFTVVQDTGATQGTAVMDTD